jgi:hypothetical protein
LQDENTNNLNSHAHIKNKNEIRIIPSTAADESLWGMQYAFMLGTTDYAHHIGAPLPGHEGTADTKAKKNVPWLSVNDLYLTPVFAGPESWPKLAKALNEMNPDNTDFVVLTGSHMDAGGLVHGDDGKIEWKYGTDSHNENKPTEFYAEDIKGAKSVANDNPNINIEVRDIWHPDLDKPSADSLRAEIKEIIASGKICIVPSCYSTDQFVKGKTEPTQDTLLQYSIDMIQERNVPVKSFVESHFGDPNDFKRPGR